MVIKPKLDSQIYFDFVFGNQGLVLMFILWSVAGFLAWGDAGTRLKKIPNIIHSKLIIAIVDLHIVIFAFIFAPCLLAIITLVPIIASTIFGYALSIILGTFLFGFFLLKLQSHILSMGYLVFVAMAIDPSQHRLNINTSEVDDIVKLPGIGKKLASRIIKNRPFDNIDDISNVQGISIKRFETIKPLIRVS